MHHAFEGNNSEGSTPDQKSPLARLQQAQAIAQSTYQQSIARWQQLGQEGLLALQRDLWDWGDRTMAAALAGQLVACDAGCTWCCYLTVPVMGLEAQVIVDWFAALPATQRQRLQQRLFSTADRLRSVQPADRLAQKIPCAFLEPDGLCGIYPVRPATCRSHHARCAETCQRGWQTGQWPARSLPVDDFALEAAIAGLQAACDTCQVPTVAGELHQALCTLIAGAASPAAAPQEWGDRTSEPGA